MWWISACHCKKPSKPPKFSSRHFPSSVHIHTASPGLLRIEGRIPYDVQRALQAKGHGIALQPDWIEGYIVSIQVDTERGVVYGGADPVASCQRSYRPMLSGGNGNGKQ